MPEEINRVAVDHMASLLLCPTEDAVANLRREGMGGPGDPLGRELHQVGDVMLDATLEFGAVAQSRSTVLRDLGLRAGGFVLATVHRAENTDDSSRLRVIVDALERVAATVPVAWPVHPRTRRVLGQSLGEACRIRLCDPLGYLDMLALERAARCIVTDSGGVQKEAFFAGVPCVTVREETEWLELVRCGWNTVVPPSDPEAIVHAVLGARPGAVGCKPYGDGDASARIASLLRRP
jgi:UDP-GlcNAc3NAcA epimerase